jgi:choline dehydrogenase
MLAGFRIERQIAATEPFKSLVAEEMHPGAAVQSDDDVRAYLRSTASTTFHPCGTCRMGEDATAVVDSTLSVRGLDGLSVVDASVMPQIPSPNIHPATIMLAEKGADLIAAQMR